MSEGPYRTETFKLVDTGYKCGHCERQMHPANNARRLGDKIVCMNCYELQRLMPDARAIVKKALALATPDQRVAMLNEWMAGYCQHCGTEEGRTSCQCWNDD